MTSSVTTVCGGGGINRIESGVLELGAQRGEWQLRLSAAAGLREHRQERSRSSSHPLPHSFLLSLSHLSHSPLLCSFAPSNRLLIGRPPFLRWPIFVALFCLFLYHNSLASLPHHVPKRQGPWQRKMCRVQPANGYLRRLKGKEGMTKIGFPTHTKIQYTHGVGLAWNDLDGIGCMRVPYKKLIRFIHMHMQ